MNRKLEARDEILHFSRDARGRLVLAGRPLFTASESELWSELSDLQRGGGQHLIVTLNVDQVVDLRVSESSQRAFRSARLRLLDGMPLVWTARLIGVRDAARNTGADLLLQAARESARRGWKIVVLGGATGVAARACEELKSRFPGASLWAVEFPFVSDLRDPALESVAQEVSAHDPDLVFVCLGAPKQEQWYLEWSGELPDAIYVGAGAAIDFAAGTKRRAPRWLQRVGLEWLWRLGQEPVRLFRRYLVKSAAFLPIVVKSLVLRGRGSNTLQSGH